jgi:hypothetical protein
MRVFIVIVLSALLVNLSRFNNWVLLTVGGVLVVVCLIVWVRAMHAEKVRREAGE